jgi:hypothetical protein
MAGRCLACSAFDLSAATGRATRRVIPLAAVAEAVERSSPARAAHVDGPARVPRVPKSAVSGPVAAGPVAAARPGRLRRALTRAARLSLVAVVVLAAVAGVRALTVIGGSAPARDQVALETPGPEFPAASLAVGVLPSASARPAQRDPSEPPAELHRGSSASTAPNGGPATGTGGGGTGGGGPTPGPTPSPVPKWTPGPGATPIPTPSPTDTPAPTPTDSPRPTPTDTPVPTPIDTPTPLPTDSPTPEP